MLISASCRPRGIKRSVTTKALYKAMGFKNEDPDLRDVVGKLELNARRPSDTIFLAALHKACGGLYGAGRVVIYDEKGKKVCERKTEKD